MGKTCFVRSQIRLRIIIVGVTTRDATGHLVRVYRGSMRGRGRSRITTLSAADVRPHVRSCRVIGARREESRRPRANDGLFEQPTEGRKPSRRPCRSREYGPKRVSWTSKLGVVRLKTTDQNARRKQTVKHFVGERAAIFISGNFQTVVLSNYERSDYRSSRSLSPVF